MSDSNNTPEVRYACSKVAAVGEVARLTQRLAEEERDCLAVIGERDTAIGFCDLFAATILGEAINWSCHETKWQEALDMLSNGKTVEVSGIMLRRSGVHAVVEAEVDGKWREVIREYIEGNFSHIVEPAGICAGRDSELNSVPASVELAPTPPAPAASEGERSTQDLRVLVKNVLEDATRTICYEIRRASLKVVTAADHDRVVADLQRKLQIREAEIGIGGSPPPYPTWMQQVESRDATIAELKKDAKEDHAVILAYQRRAEAAEAKCAELESLAKCRGCGKVLRIENSWMCDGCPCNCEAGTNHGLVPKDCCICDECYASSNRTKLHHQLAAANERVAALTKERDGLREVLEIAKAACEKNLCYAHYKDEQSLYKALAIINKQLSQPKGGA